MIHAQDVVRSKRGTSATHFMVEDTVFAMPTSNELLEDCTSFATMSTEKNHWYQVPQLRHRVQRSYWKEVLSVALRFLIIVVYVLVASRSELVVYSIIAGCVVCTPLFACAGLWFSLKTLRALEPIGISIGTDSIAVDRSLMNYGTVIQKIAVADIHSIELRTKAPQRSKKRLWRKSFESQLRSDLVVNFNDRALKVVRSFFRVHPLIQDLDTCIHEIASLPTMHHVLNDENVDRQTWLSAFDALRSFPSPAKAVDSRHGSTPASISPSIAPDMDHPTQ